jgi:hypothetical protein
MSLRRFMAAALAALLLASCGHGLSANAIGFRVESNVPDAVVWIDDVQIGTTREWSAPGRQIRAGFHRVEIRHPGYYSFFQEIDQPAGQVVVVNAQLHELVE